MWTIAETMVTTRIITPLSVSRRSDHATSTPPAAIQVTKVCTCGADCPMTSRNTRMPNAADSTSAPQVTICAPRSPIARPKNPAIAAAKSCRKTTRATTALTPHHPDVLDPDRPAVAEINQQNGEPDSGFRRRHRQHEHREDLADQIVEHDREGNEIDVDREQHQLDRHQDDDDVLAVEKNPENPEREEDCRDGQVMSEPDRHGANPRPRRRPAP